jgi:hypothetical protein
MVTYMSEGGDPKLWSPICLREEILRISSLRHIGDHNLGSPPLDI